MSTCFTSGIDSAALYTEADLRHTQKIGDVSLKFADVNSVEDGSALVHTVMCRKEKNVVGSSKLHLDVVQGRNFERREPSEPVSSIVHGD